MHGKNVILKPTILHLGYQGFRRWQWQLMKTFSSRFWPFPVDNVSTVIHSGTCDSGQLSQMAGPGLRCQQICELSVSLEALTWYSGPPGMQPRTPADPYSLRSLSFCHHNMVKWLHYMGHINSIVWVSEALWRTVKNVHYVLSGHVSAFSQFFRHIHANQMNNNKR